MALMNAMFTTEEMATRTVTGKNGEKDALDDSRVQLIIRE